MTEVVREATTVAIIGSGPAGLTLANLLRRLGLDCVVIERQSRSYVEQRQRAGVLDHHAVRVFEESGLADRLLADAPVNGVLEIRVDGVPHHLDVAGLMGGLHGRLLPQQFLVRRLIATFVEAGGDLRFEATDVGLSGLESARPAVVYLDAAGVRHEIECDYVAGCDGFHGASRRSVPEDRATVHAYDHGIGWFTVLAEVPPYRHALMAVSPQGFAAQFARGPRASRFYLQCQVGDDLDGWPDDRIWAQLRQRLGNDGLPAAPITEKAVVEMRSFVIDPMSYGRLFLVGDAAHIITPVGGKGMNIAIADADELARALVSAVRDGDQAGLLSYSAVCLRRTWAYQEFSHWMTEALHDAGDDTVVGPFRWHLARARLDRLFSSGPVAVSFAEMMVGV